MNNEHRKTLALRVIVTGIIAATTTFPDFFQPFLDKLWAFLRTNAFYKSSVFETVWTVFNYAVIEPFITYIFIQYPHLRIPDDAKGATETKADDANGGKKRSQPRGMKRPSRRLREGLTYVAPLLLMDLTMIKKFADVSLEDKLKSGNYDTATLQASHSGHFLMPSLHNFEVSSPLQTTRALPTEAPTSRRVVLELIASLVIYDAVFFLFHLSLHIVPWLKRWHGAHHTHHEIHPQITNQLSIFERLGLVLLANFSLNIIGSHVVTRTLFVPLFVWLLVEIHSGIDTWWSYDKLLPSGWGGGAKRHKLHHEFGFEGGGVEPFFCWCDDLYRWATGVL